jgi:antagonist of KipI
VSKVTITVLRPGVCSTIQDLGRFGYQDQGVSPSGALDPVSLKTANSLVGNDPGAAAIEMVQVGAQIALKGGLVIAFAGGAVAPVISGVSLPMLRPIFILGDVVIDIGQVTNGNVAYMSVRGGICVEKVSGSRSTHLGTKTGGLNGVALRRGDQLSVAVAKINKRDLVDRGVTFSSDDVGTPPWSIRPTVELPGEFTDIRFIPSKIFQSLEKVDQQKFLDTDFVLSPTSNRMGYRLTGNALNLDDNANMKSRPVCIGTIQVPPDGQPIVLMAERQTTGGYPGVGEIITADLCRFSQARVGQTVRFVPVSVEVAQERMIRLEKEIKTLFESISQRMSELLV